MLAAAAVSSSPGRKTAKEEEEGSVYTLLREGGGEGALGRLLRLQFLGFTVRKCVFS